MVGFVGRSLLLVLGLESFNSFVLLDGFEQRQRCLGFDAFAAAIAVAESDRWLLRGVISLPLGGDGD